MQSLYFVDLFSQNISLFCYTNGSLYNYDEPRGVTRLLKNKNVSGGLSCNTTTNQFYYSDTCALIIRQFDWNPATGDIKNERIAFDFQSVDESQIYAADGIMIDNDGNLFAALYNGTAIWKINPKYLERTSSFDYTILSFGFDSDLSVIKRFF